MTHQSQNLALSRSADTAESKLSGDADNAKSKLGGVITTNESIKTPQNNFVNFYRLFYRNNQNKIQARMSYICTTTILLKAFVVKAKNRDCLKKSF
jgi:hypothetical protein